jgi:4-hydroxy-tetrahydrodipicolinate reductase
MVRAAPAARDERFRHGEIMKKVVVIGAAGRMGRAIIRCLSEGRVEGLKLFGAVDLWDQEDLGKDVGPLAGVGTTGVFLTSDLGPIGPQADVLIDFSTHTSTAGNAERLAGWGSPWVVGTTGLAGEELEAVRAASDRIPVVMAPNMSFGVNLLLALARETASVLKGKGYDIEVIERHHRRKKDAPSGTALALGHAVAEGSGWDLETVAVHGREGVFKGERPEEQIGFHAVRGGDIVGDHTVIFAADGECIELSHRATSRDAFAVGALRAAAWAMDREPGLYSMKDVLAL